MKDSGLALLNDVRQTTVLLDHWCALACASKLDVRYSYRRFDSAGGLCAHFLRVPTRDRTMRDMDGAAHSQHAHDCKGAGFCNIVTTGLGPLQLSLRCSWLIEWCDCAGWRTGRADRVSFLGISDIQCGATPG
jgi:hypothetical protein